MNGQREFRKLKKLLKKDGYTQKTEGNHPKFEKGEFTVVVTQNSRGAKRDYQNVQTNYKRWLENKGE